MHAPLDRVGVLGREPSVPDEGQVDVGEPRKLAVEQDARAHLDVADKRLQARRARQGVEHHCIVKAVFPCPGAPPMSVTSPGPISIRASSPVPTG